MDPVEFEFPLTKLPLLAREHVYRTMKSFDRMTSTLSSKRVKKEIKGLRFNYSDMTIMLSDTIDFSPDNLAYGSYYIQFDDPLHFIESRSTVRGASVDPGNNPEHIWDLPHLNGIGWINDFIDIFDVKEISLALFENCQTFDVADVLQCFRAMEMRTFEVLREDTPTDWLQQMLQAFPAKRYYFRPDPFENKPLLHDFLSKGFEEITFDDNVKLDLTDIQVMKCIAAEVEAPTFTDIEINVFLRVWMDGWNTTLKFLHVWFKRNRISRDYQGQMLRGLEHTLIEEERTFDIVAQLVHKEFRNGYDLVRSDGMKATLYTHRRDRRYVDMFFMVWP